MEVKDYKCPADHNVTQCISKMYGITCETCVYGKEIKLKELTIDDLVENIVKMKSLMR